MKKQLTVILTTYSLFLTTFSFSQSYTISTFAGNGHLGFSGDGGSATSAELFYPYCTAADAAGNIYIADIDNERIRVVNTSGVISTFAGNGTQGFSGDGGAATLAEINQPTEVYADAAGNIYISGDSRVRIVNTSGIITTFAGNGVTGFYGDGGPATSAEFNTVGGVTQDPAGNIYIADGNNNRIRMVNSGGTISTFAGSGSAGYNGDGGPATSYELNYPVSVSADASGKVYIGDYFNNRVRRVNTSGRISTYAGTGFAGFSGDGGAASSAELDWPDGIFVDATGNLFISDEVNVRIRMVNTGGIISTIAGNGAQGFYGDGGPATSAEMDNIMSVSVDSYGNVYIPDYTNDRVRMLTKVTTSINDLAANTENWTIYPNPNNGKFSLVVSLASGESDNRLEIYNVLGEKVFMETLMPQTPEGALSEIDLRGQPNGIYFYRVLANNATLTGAGKIVIE